MRPNRKFWLCCLIALSVAIGCSFYQGPSLAALFDRQALIQFFSASRVNSTGPSGLSIGFFVLAHIAANAIGIPGTLLVIVGGAVYGLWWGTLWSLIGATLGAIVAFWLARYLLHGWFKQRFHRHPLFKKLNHTLCYNALGCVLTVRFSPVSPFNVVNFAFGLTSVPLSAYAVGTLLGIVPGTLAYTWLGVTGAEAFSSGRLLPLFCGLLGLMLLSALPIVIRCYRSST